MHMAGGAAAQGPPKFADMMAFVNQPEKPVKISETTISSDSIPNNDRAAPNKTKQETRLDGPDGLTMVKTFFDIRMLEMEARILREVSNRLDAMEARQSATLNAILLAIKPKSQKGVVSEEFQLD